MTHSCNNCEKTCQKKWQLLQHLDQAHGIGRAVKWQKMQAQDMAKHASSALVLLPNHHAVVPRFGHGSKRVSSRVSRTVEVEHVKMKKVVRPNFDVVFVIDCSGSMSGRPLRDVLSSVKSICDEVLKPNDGIGIVTFESRVSVLAPLAFKRNIAPELDGLLASVHAGGRTALWDGMREGLRMLHTRKRIRPPKPSHPFLIVLTDGCDCVSSATASQLRAMIAKPKEHGMGGIAMANFHANVITVGSGADQAEMQKLVGKKQHLAHFHAPSAAEIKATFRNKVRTFLQMVMTRTVHTRETTETFAVALAGHKGHQPGRKGHQPGHKKGRGEKGGRGRGRGPGK